MKRRIKFIGISENKYLNEIVPVIEVKSEIHNMDFI
jgi:hypothetical protein